MKRSVFIVAMLVGLGFSYLLGSWLVLVAVIAMAGTYVALKKQGANQA